MLMSEPLNTKLTSLVAHLRARFDHLWKDRSGLALVEFALSTPIILALGTYGIETSNLAMAHMRVSQVALNVADNMSRIGQDSALSLKQLREVDINNSFQAAVIQGGSYDITTHGRIILSSLENDTTNGDWIHWQRCKGLLNKPSSYGLAGDGAGSATFYGMGEVGKKILPPTNGAVMFVEIFYEYQPIFGMNLFGSTPIEIHYKAAYTVRDSRDLTQVYNPSPAATASLCTIFSA